MLATEEPTHPAPEGDSTALPLETHATNARMRHVPSAEWLAAKLDGDVRRRLETLWLAASNLEHDDPHFPAVERELRLLCRALDHVAGIARHHRGHPHPPSDLGQHLRWSIDHTLAALRAPDETFARRFPFHTGERSNAEPLWGCFLKVLWHINRLTELAREFNPSVDERLLEGLVQLREPLRLEPIA